MFILLEFFWFSVNRKCILFIYQQKWKDILEHNLLYSLKSRLIVIERVTTIIYVGSVIYNCWSCASIIGRYFVYSIFFGQLFDLLVWIFTSGFPSFIGLNRNWDWNQMEIISLEELYAILITCVFKCVDYFFHFIWLWSGLSVDYFFHFIWLWSGLSVQLILRVFFQLCPTDSCCIHFIWNFHHFHHFLMFFIFYALSSNFKPILFLNISWITL